VVSDSDETPVRDAGLIAAAQKVEHDETSGYGSARQFRALPPVSVTMRGEFWKFLPPWLAIYACG